jgi:hypothetical protein
MKKERKTGIITIIFSLIILIYFIRLVSVSYLHINLTIIEGAFVELFTIPMIILSVILYFYNFNKIYKEGWILKSYYFISLIILTLVVLLLILASAYNN